MATTDLEMIFADLRERMLRSCPGMQVTQDDHGNIVLKTPWIEPGKKEPAWFGAIQLKKNYVSCHLMPLYALPDLREQVPLDLEKRMQGKSCFNFRKVEPALFDAFQQFAELCVVAYANPVAAKPH